MHGVTVRLRPAEGRGVIASVHLPGALVVSESMPTREPAAVGKGRIGTPLPEVHRNGFSHNGSPVIPAPSRGPDEQTIRTDKANVLSGTLAGGPTLPRQEQPRP